MLDGFAWRNAWRNKRRSGILVASIAFGMGAGLLMIALMNGMARQQVDAAVSTRTAHIQLHAEGFRAHHDLQLALSAGDSLLSVLQETPGVEAAAGRAVLSAMAASAGTGRGVLVMGVDPETESQVCDLAAHLEEGSWFESKKARPAVVGRKLVDLLGLKLGQKLVITGQGGDGLLQGGAYRITGIFRTANSEFDGSTVFVKRSDLNQGFALEGRLHEIAIRLQDIDQLQLMMDQFSKRWPNLEVADWKKLSPDVALTADATDQMNGIFLAVLLVALVFGITNTMLMGVIERRREFGLLLALGLRPSRLVIQVLLETVFLVVAGALLGLLSGVLLSSWLSHTGIDLSAFAEGMAALGMGSVIRPELSAGELPRLLAWTYAAALAGALWPALRVRRMRAVDAMRME